MWTVEFWRRAGERAVKTFAQTLVLLWGADAGLNVLTVNPLPALGIAGTGALLSVLTSLASSGLTGQDTPSLLGPQVVTVADEPGDHADLDGDGRIG